MDVTEVVTGGDDGARPGTAIPVKRAIESVLTMLGAQDLARVTRSAFSEMHGTYFVTIQMPETRFYLELRGPGEAKAKVEGVMRDYNRDYPGRFFAAREP